MNWDQLIGKIREGLTESGAYLRTVGYLLGEASENGNRLTAESAKFALTSLALAMSDLHSVVEHLAIGLDAVVGVYREADKSQEVKGE